MCDHYNTPPLPPHTLTLATTTYTTHTQLPLMRTELQSKVKSDNKPSYVARRHLADAIHRQTTEPGGGAGADPVAAVRLIPRFVCLSLFLSDSLTHRRRLCRPCLCLIFQSFLSSTVSRSGLEKKEEIKKAFSWLRKKSRNFWRAALAEVAMPTSASPILLTRTPPLQLLCYPKSVGQRRARLVCVCVCVCDGRLARWLMLHIEHLRIQRKTDWLGV